MSPDLEAVRVPEATYDEALAVTGVRDRVQRYPHVLRTQVQIVVLACLDSSIHL
jgi:hypothetical protein